VPTNTGVLGNVLKLKRSFPIIENRLILGDSCLSVYDVGDISLVIGQVREFAVAIASPHIAD
jgi:hypothetical protein